MGGILQAVKRFKGFKGIQGAQGILRIADGLGGAAKFSSVQGAPIVGLQVIYPKP